MYRCAPARAARRLLAGAMLTCVAALAQGAETVGAAVDGKAGAASQKVLRYAIRAAESGFDPPQVSDAYSRTMMANVFDALYAYAFLARPVRAVPNTATALPEASADFKTFTIRVRPGIYFSDDPAFNGRKRELVAADYVYSIKRHYDPRLKSSSYASISNNQIIGLNELRDATIKSKKPFDYDTATPGLRALDRYTLQFKLGLATWKRSSLIAFEKNPNYRDEFYNEQAPVDDALAQAAVARLKGRKLPMVDRVEVSVIEQPQPRWLSFLNREMDVIEQVPEDFANIVMPNNKLAPNLAKLGFYDMRYPRIDAALSYFGMENSVVGGYTPAKVALRRAIALAVNVEEEIRMVRRGQAVAAQSIVAPGVWGYDPQFRSEMSTFDRARAKALLDLNGYVDRNGDGWREQPDGTPLQVEYATQPDDASRQLITQWKKNMDAIGIRIKFKTAQWPENLKASRAGKLMMWGVSWSANIPDGEQFLLLGQSIGKGQANHARFDLPKYDRLFDLQRRLPNGPGRLHAVQSSCAPHLDRSRAAVVRRLPPQYFRARVVALRRH